MNTTAEMGAADQKPKPNTPPPPPPLPEFKPTAAKGDDHHFHSTINLISEPERGNKMDEEMDEEKDEESSSCSSSYSSSDSESGFFQINPPELAYPPPSPTPANLYMDGVEKISNPNKEKPSGSGTERRSPVVQSMVRDPNRIPSSIFARSPVTPMEWSVASNESLFSIHMEHSSFSKDQMFLTGRSGELRGFASGTIEYPLPWISPDSRSAAAAAGGVGRREVGDLVMEIDEAAAATANAEAMREVMKAAVEGKESEKKVMLGRSISRHSDGSTTSFAFPILTGDGRIGSIKVNFEHHKDHHQLNQQIKPSKILSDKGPTATMRSHRSAHGQGPASVQSKWFQCFSGRKFRCCCDY